MTVELVNFPKTEISPTFQSPIKLLAELTVEMHGDLSMMITLQPRLIGKGSNGEMIKSSADEIQSGLQLLQVADLGLSAISKCSNLEVLHIVKAPECSNFGLICVAENCKLLRKLHIDGWRTNRIGDEGLIAISKECPNIQEIVLIEFACIAAKYVALKKLCIKGCPISNVGLEMLAWGCPSLSKIKVKKCRGVSGEAAESIGCAQWLQSALCSSPSAVVTSRLLLRPSTHPVVKLEAPSSRLPCSAQVEGLGFEGWRASHAQQHLIRPQHHQQRQHQQRDSRLGARLHPCKFPIP
ncbi:hypothetical protein ACFX15_042525 [Malus domestica]